MAINRDIKYVNRDFTSLRNSLVDYTKTYFPNTYNDFTPSSPGMMFMEMAAYVGDVLSFYVDNQFQETFIQYARQSQNLYDLAYMMGYKPKATTAATTQLDVYQQLPSKDLGGGNYVPDYSYALQIPEATPVTSNLSGSLQFIIQDKIDFASSGSMDPTTVTVYQTAGSVPTYFLLKKTRKAISADISTTSFTYTSPIPFSNNLIVNENIIGVLDIIDSNGNEWYEVDYLAQDAVYDSIKNSNPNDPNLSSDTNIAYLLKTKQVAKRFATRFLNKTTLQLQFGSGNPGDTTEELIPNPDNVGLGLPSEQDKLTTAFSPTNYIFTNSYGIAPSNTTLTVRYLVGGGVSANAPASTLTILNTNNVKFINSTVANTTLASQIFGTLLVNNPEAATGGSDGDDINEIRQNSMGNFQNQLRNVTFDDYVVRSLSLPPIYGTISKVYASKPQSSSNSNNTLDLYVLSYNDNKELTTATPALKQNLATYLAEYKMINDAIGILDAFIINIGINFEIITLPSYNSDEVILKCISALKVAFNIDKWQINQPIMLRDLNILIDNVEGVQTVKKIEFTNKTGENLGYSDYSYDILGATTNNVIYPSIDPMIFELKYPNTDIQGKVVPL
tara:strand:- start:7309 stop:9159 length:1851 start_codon:yes stop_codon:yes gene_type:complete